MSFDYIDVVDSQARIKVIGVGGGGGNAVSHMIQSGIEGVGFICANTDSQALSQVAAQLKDSFDQAATVKDVTTLQIGQSLTKGLGAGARPEVGKEAAKEDKDVIKEAIADADMLFITAGMGGGTGTGAAPIIAQIAKDLGILTVAVVTKPFSFEGARRMKYAEQGLEELAVSVDSLITIPNQKLISTLGADITFLEAFAKANDVLKNAVQGISELITLKGLMNVDFADVRTVMSETGMAMMGSATARGENRAADVANMAMSSPLLEDVNLTGAKGVLINITSGQNIGLGEVREICEMIEKTASEDAQIVVGAGFDDKLQDEVRVTIVATGLGAKKKAATKPTVDLVKIKSSGEPDYAELDKPTAIRRNQFSVEDGLARDKDDEEYFDVPAFLRKQAD